jgi:hypothetical protein
MDTQYPTASVTIDGVTCTLVYLTNVDMILNVSDDRFALIGALQPPHLTGKEVADALTTAGFTPHTVEEHIYAEDQAATAAILNPTSTPKRSAHLTLSVGATEPSEVKPEADYFRKDGPPASAPDPDAEMSMKDFIMRLQREPFRLTPKQAMDKLGLKSLQGADFRKVLEQLIEVMTAESDAEAIAAEYEDDGRNAPSAEVVIYALPEQQKDLYRMIAGLNMNVAQQQVWLRNASGDQALKIEDVMQGKASISMATLSACLVAYDETVRTRAKHTKGAKGATSEQI